MKAIQVSGAFLPMSAAMDATNCVWQDTVVFLYRPITNA